MRTIRRTMTAARMQIPGMTTGNLSFLRFLVLFGEVGIDYIITGIAGCCSGIPGAGS